MNTDNIIHWINDKYKPLLDDRKRFNILYGGAGSGKSVFACQRDIIRLLFEPGHNFAVFRKVGRSSRFSTFAETKYWLSLWNLRHLVKINQVEMTITCIQTNNTMLFAGLDNVEKVKSIKFPSGVLTDVRIEEATECRPEDVKQLDLRLRGLGNAYPYQMTLCFNPISSKHWLKTMFFDSDDFHGGDCTILKTTYKDNKFLDQKYIDRLERLKLTDEQFYQVYALGNWGSCEGLVFTNWIEQAYDFEDKHFEKFFCGMDFGFNHASSLQLMGLRQNKLYSIYEFHAKGLTNAELIAAVKKENVIKRNIEIIAESVEPARIKEWQQAGFNCRKVNKTTIVASIDALKRYEWVVHPRCVNLLNELGQYHWKKDKNDEATDEPIKYNDDAIAACRYAVESLYSSKDDPVKLDFSVLDRIF